jgi:hypothetical protein
VTVSVEIDGKRYELREDGPLCSRVYCDGVELERFRLNYTPRSSRKPGRMGAPTAEVAQAHLRNVHEYLKNYPGEVSA